MKPGPILAVILLALVMLVGACQPPTPTIPPPPLPTSTSQATSTLIPTQVPSPTATIAGLDQANTSSPEALAACDLEKQTSALLPEQVPDWTILGIDTCYNLAFVLADDGKSYTGSAHITYTNLSNQPLDDLVLRLYPNAPVIYGGRLSLDEARIGEQVLQPESLLDDGTAVSLALPEPLTPQATLTLELSFNGQLLVDNPGDQTYGIFNFDSSSSIAMLANSYPMVAAREGGQWRVDPVLAEGDAVVSTVELYLAEIRVPKDWKVASTGSVLEMSQIEGQDVFQIAGGPVREFTWTASPSFEERTELVRDVFLDQWALPDTEASWTEALKVSQDAMGVFDDTFGAYPYSELDIVVLPLKNASGVEYPGLILLASELYIDTSTPRLLPLVAAHEIAHQWWYGMVGSDVLRAPWQDEALATFSSQLYASKFDPVFYEGTEAFYKQRVDAVQAEYGVQPIAQPVSAFAGKRSAYAVIEYQKGELFFEAVRSQIGEEAFYQALQNYLAAYRYRTATPNDLLGSFESSCGCDLQGLYNEWGVR